MKISGYARLMVAVLLGAALMPASVSAILPDPQRLPSNLLFNQSQAYDVHFRGNGEAIVNARITLTNIESTEVNTLTYTLGTGQITEITAFQEVQGTACTTKPGATSAPSSSQPVPDIASAKPSNCVNTDSNSPVDYYPYYRTYYKKADAKTEGQKLTINLPEAVVSNETATVVLAYAANGYAAKKWGVFDYSFATLKATTRVKDVSVAVTVDDDYYLAGTKGKVNYREVYGASDLAARLPSSASSAEGAKTDAAYIQGIGQYGGVVKQASQLAADESFTVSGRYATSQWQLNLPKYLAVAGTLLLLAAAYYMWYRVRRKKLDGNGSSGTGPSADGRRQALPFAGVAGRVSKAVIERRIWPIFFGWGCAVAVMAALFAGVLLTRYATEYDSYTSTELVGLLMPLFLIAGFAALIIGGLVAAFGLPWAYGRISGIRTVLKIIGHQVLFLTVVALVLGLVVANIQADTNGIYPMEDCPNCAISPTDAIR